jgi:hypothetical protein
MRLHIGIRMFDLVISYATFPENGNVPQKWERSPLLNSFKRLDANLQANNFGSPVSFTGTNEDCCRELIQILFMHIDRCIGIDCCAGTNR